MNLETLVNHPTLPTKCMFDMDIYRGEIPIIGHIPLSEADRMIPFPKTASIGLTLNVTKQDLVIAMQQAPHPNA